MNLFVWNKPHDDDYGTIQRAVTFWGWEDNHRSGDVMATHHRLGGLPIYGRWGPRPYPHFAIAPFTIFTFNTEKNVK